MKSKAAKAPMKMPQVRRRRSYPRLCSFMSQLCMPATKHTRITQLTCGKAHSAREGRLLQSLLIRKAL